MIKCSEINIELTNVCTMNCDFCSLSELTRSNSFMNDEIFYKTADDIINNNLTDLILPYLMGESLLHKKWFEYISYLTNKTKNSKTDINLITNGAHLDSNTLNLLCKTNLNHLFISVQQWDQAGYYKRKIKKNISFEEYNKSITNAVKIFTRETDIKISLYYLISTSNDAQNFLGNGYIDSNNKGYSILNKWFQFFKENEINTYPLEEILKLQNNAEHEIGLTDRFSIIFKPFTTWGDYLRKKLPTSSNIIPNNISCSHIDGKTLAIFCDGQIGICCEDYDAEFNFGNIKDMSLNQVLNGKKYVSFLKNFNSGGPLSEKCKNCLNLI